MKITQEEEEKNDSNEPKDGGGREDENAQSGKLEECVSEQESGDGEDEVRCNDSEMNEIVNIDEVGDESHGSETGMGERRNSRDDDEEEKYVDTQGFSDEELDEGWENQKVTRDDNKYWEGDKGEEITNVDIWGEDESETRNEHTYESEDEVHTLGDSDTSVSTNSTAEVGDRRDESGQMSED